MPSKVTSVKMDDDLRARVAALAAARQRKPHWIMLEAIREYVEREEKQQQCWDEALAAWQRYQETGLHVTQQEMDAWLGQLETGNDVEPPQCHK